MTRGGARLDRVHYKGVRDDFFVFLDNVEDFRKWLRGSSIPLAQVLNSFQIFRNHRHGNQGIYDTASNAELDNEFGTHKQIEIIEKILREGTLTEDRMVERNGSRNIANGGWATGIVNGAHQ